MRTDFPLGVAEIAEYLELRLRSKVNDYSVILGSAASPTNSRTDIAER